MTSAERNNIHDLRIVVGDAREKLRELNDGVARCCVTSPPYWGLRDYGAEGQIGLEATPEAFVAQLVEVFREVRRVLADDGTLWLNLGDSYAGSGRGGYAGKASTLDGSTEGQDLSRVARGSMKPAGYHESARSAGAIGRAWVPPPGGLKPKNMVGVPWRVAFALQADGWFLRSDIIWAKPNPMPSSVRDRPTGAHEYLFLLAKGKRYYYNAAAVAEAAVSSVKKATDMRRGSSAMRGQASIRPRGKNEAQPDRRRAGFNDRWDAAEADGSTKQTRNRRTVWTIAPRPFPGAHFATYPPELVEPCILAGSAPGDLVLDPFNGTGTTGLVALRHGRRYVGVEINPEYAAMARDRIEREQSAGYQAAML